MSDSRRAWVKAKTEQTIRKEIELLGQSLSPDEKLAYAMIDYAHSLGLFTHIDHDYWKMEVSNAVDMRLDQIMEGKG